MMTIPRTLVDGAAGGRAVWPLALGALAGAVVFATGLLWATQGGAVFYALLSAGLAICF